MAVRKALQAEQNTPISQGGTGINTYQKGDMLYANGQNSLARLAIGAEGKVLQSKSGIPSWEASGMIPATGTLGAILYWSGSSWITLPAGTDNTFLKLSGSKPLWFNLFGSNNLWTGLQTFSTINGINLVNTILEFSIDGTLAGNSDSAVPTEKAVKTYVDTQDVLYESELQAFGMIMGVL